MIVSSISVSRSSNSAFALSFLSFFEDIIACRLAGGL